MEQFQAVRHPTEDLSPPLGQGVPRATIGDTYAQPAPGDTEFSKTSMRDPPSFLRDPLPWYLILQQLLSHAPRWGLKNTSVAIVTFLTLPSAVSAVTTAGLW